MNNKCKYCGSELFNDWCSCEGFLVNEKGLDKVVDGPETKGKLGGRNSSSAKVISLDCFNLDKFIVDEITPRRYLTREECCE